MITGRLYLVATPRERMSEAELLARIDDALDGGVDVLQLRCKGWEALDYIRLAERVQPLAQRRGVPFIINDRPDVALAIGADGVHLGQKDLPVEVARKILADKIIGRSSHEAADAERAIAERASYFAVGPVWETPTKPGRPAAGLSYVRAVVSRETPMPWFAIGGINLDNVPDVLAAGAERIAVVRAVLDAPDSGAAARAFVEALLRHPERSSRHPALSSRHPERSSRHPERSEGSALPMEVA
jgi:thiamine-phosphate pyrophosphorylase